MHSNINMQRESGVNPGKLILYNNLMSLFNVVLFISGAIIVVFGWVSKCSLDKFPKLEDDYMSNLPLLLMIIGHIHIIVGVCAYTSINALNSLIRYGTFLFGVCFLIAMISSFVLGYTALGANIYDDYGRKLNNSMLNYVDGRHNLIDEVQIKLECCGYFGPGDWLNTQIKKIPQSCCKIHFCDSTLASDIFPESCMTKLSNFLRPNINSILATVIATGIVQFVGALLAFNLAYHIIKFGYQSNPT
uniref:Tetraspanin n=1 Tax=Clastoptera arizonana TaxID=38151 RepID=A0A1B6CWW7_9HEMI